MSIRQRVAALEQGAKEVGLVVRPTAAIAQRIQELRDEALAQGLEWAEPDQQSRALIAALLEQGQRTVWVNEEDEKL